MSVELQVQPCPHCASPRAHAQRVPSSLPIWNVLCGNCYASGPWAGSRDEAIISWNERETVFEDHVQQAVNKAVQDFSTKPLPEKPKTPEYHCNMCGYVGPEENHSLPYDIGKCFYLAGLISLNEKTPS